MVMIVICLSLQAGNAAADLAHQKGHREVCQALPDQSSKIGTWWRLFSK